MESPVKQRLIEYLKCKKISKSKFEMACGMCNGYINSIRKSISPEKFQSIALSFPDLNREWLLYGEGEMLNEVSAKKDDSDEYKLVPLYHLDSVGGMHNYPDLPEKQWVEKMIPFEGAREDDVAIWQTGDSMSPTIPPGSIMLIRKVEDWQEYFGYGHVFVVFLRDGRRITKEINRSKEDPTDYVLCVSHNKSYAEEELPKKLIVGVWRVIKVMSNC